MLLPLPAVMSSVDAVTKHPTYHKNSLSTRRN